MFATWDLGGKNFILILDSWKNGCWNCLWRMARISHFIHMSLWSRQHKPIFSRQCKMLYLSHKESVWRSYSCCMSSVYPNNRLSWVVIILRQCFELYINLFRTYSMFLCFVINKTPNWMNNFKNIFLSCINRIKDHIVQNSPNELSFY